MRCLEKQPADRFSDAKAFGDALSVVLETRRETPAPVRVFVRDSLELRSGGCLYVFVVFSSMSVVITAILRLVPGPLQGWAIAAYFAAALLGVPFLAHVWRTRRLLQAGYGMEDVLRAVHTDMERKREELAVTWGQSRPVLESGLRKTGWLAVAVGFATSLAGSFLGLGRFGFGGGAIMLLGLVTVFISQRRRDVMGERRLKYFGGRLGRWVFRLAGSGLEPRQITGSRSDQPTELAIAFAAGDLYAELPREIKAAVPGLPETIKRLEQHARTIRTRIEQLEESLAATGGRTLPGAELKRSALRAELQSARDAARVRLAETVAALETIRLDLLRLRAGAGSVARVTADLQEADAVGAAVDRLLAGHEEIARALEGE